jgi:hypothetical protein
MLLVSLSLTAGAQEIPIAGTAPDARPEGAPRVQAYAKDAAWYCKALVGVERPYPASLGFLEDQGGWHTPFTVPGMTGPYDIRNWHRPYQCGRSQDVARR